MREHYFNLTFSVLVSVLGIKGALIMWSASHTASTAGNWIAFSIMCLMVTSAQVLAYMSADRIVRAWNKRNNND